MRSLISYLVAASLALHSLLGCCVHHAHAEHADLGTLCETCDHRTHEVADHDGNDHEAAPHDAAGCAAHRHHDEADRQSPACEHVVPDAVAAVHEHDDHGAPCSGSCGDKCQFVTIGRVQLENPMAWLDIALTPSDIVDLTADVPRVRSEAWLTAPPPLPLRLHLWNGLLLI